MRHHHGALRLHEYIWIITKRNRSSLLNRQLYRRSIRLCIFRSLATWNLKQWTSSRIRSYFPPLLPSCQSNNGLLFTRDIPSPKENISPTKSRTKSMLVLRYGQRSHRLRPRTSSLRSKRRFHNHSRSFHRPHHHHFRIHPPKIILWVDRPKRIIRPTSKPR